MSNKVARTKLNISYIIKNENVINTLTKPHKTTRKKMFQKKVPVTHLSALLTPDH